MTKDQTDSQRAHDDMKLEDMQDSNPADPSSRTTRADAYCSPSAPITPAPSPAPLQQQSESTLLRDLQAALNPLMTRLDAMALDIRTLAEQQNSLAEQQS